MSSDLERFVEARWPEGVRSELELRTLEDLRGDD